jgi:ABC-type nitrate/sulfonate/bicarbonate transport system permease component
MKKTILKFIIGILVSLIIGYLIYLAVYYSQPDDSSFKKGLSIILEEVINSNIHNQKVGYYQHILFSVLHFSIPFLFSMFFGISFGIIFSLNKKINSVSNFFIDFLRVLPSIVFIGLFKYSINTKKLINEVLGIDNIEYVYFVVLIASIWPIIIATKEGVQKVNKTSNMVIQQLNIPWFNKLKIFILPEAFPNIFNGVKISIAIALLIAITCEYITPEIHGLGALLQSYEIEANGYYFHTIIVIISIGLLGLFINFILELIENNLSWLNNQYKTNDTQ